MQTRAALRNAIAAVLVLGLCGCAGSFGKGKDLPEIIEAIEAAEPRIKEFEAAFDTDGGGSYGTATVVDILAPELYAAPSADRAEAILEIARDGQEAAGFETSWVFLFWTEEEWAARNVREPAAPSIDAKELFGEAFPAATVEATPYRGTFYENRLSLEPALDDGTFPEEHVWLPRDLPTWSGRRSRVADAVKESDRRILEVEAIDADDEVDGVEHHDLELQVTVQPGTALTSADLIRTIEVALAADSIRYDGLQLEVGIDDVGPLDLTPLATSLWGPPGQEGELSWDPSSFRHPAVGPDLGLILRDAQALLRHAKAASSSAAPGPASLS